MTMKSTPTKTVAAREPAASELKTAYQLHTLVQMLTARLARAPGWAPVVPAPFPPVLH
jgi:hypothetical protein